MSENSRLENKSIAALRANMIKSDLPGLLAIREDIYKKCKGGNEHMDFQATLLRDVYAYAIIKLADGEGLTLFGGFVKSHLSGLVWNDMDFMCEEFVTFSHVRTRILRLLKFMFGLKATDIRMREKKKEYAKCFVFSIQEKHSISFSISVDLSKIKGNANGLFNATTFDGLFIPCSIGSCLKICQGVVMKRNHVSFSTQMIHWDVKDIVDIVSQGKDVGLPLPPNVLESKSETWRMRYSDYYWTRIDKMKSDGFCIIASMDEEPPRLTEQ